MDIVQIDISTKCHLKCSNCTRLIAHQPKREDMPLETFERAVRSMEGWDGENRVIGIIAGEPTLHHDFERISRRFAELWGGPLTGNGRRPVADFNDLATERLFDRSTGRGLWTSLGAGFYRHYETIMEVYGHWNTNTHESGGRHQALLITREDYIARTGISQEQWEKNRDDCWVQRMWSAAINDKGAYFCEVAAAIDRLYFDGAHAWPVEQGWWQRTPADFKQQLDLCNYCALAQPGPSQLDTLDRDVISPQSRKLLQQAGSPAVRKGHFELFDTAYHAEKRVVDRRDNYVGSDRRVGIGNRSAYPRRLSAVLVSVGYGAALAQTLPHNVDQFDELVVVTTTTDSDTQAVARQHGAKLVLSDRCWDDAHSFNKGRMLNDGLAALSDPDWVVLTDADVFMNEGLRAFVLNHALNPGCLYFTQRHERGAVAGQDDAVNMQPNGYFQLFHPRAAAIRDRWPKAVSEAFCSAGSVDTWFAQQWGMGKLIPIPDLAVSHLSSRWLGENWNGVAKREGSWSQLGILTTNGFSTFLQIQQLPDVIKLTDTLYGDTVELETRQLNDHVQLAPEGLVFRGRLIGQAHIHVAYRG
ncbi:hypothetical protein CKO45_18595 [Paracraurococcus ruber]|uniref:Uncharacterized protein n=2 Tax=Paracraurococcus ruber TaxID=77675 RepID=A0ABS1D0W1_9PROT|nr:hypothetical protein [Paracraurococcus ruber]